MLTSEPKAYMDVSDGKKPSEILWSRKAYQNPSVYSNKDRQSGSLSMSKCVHYTQSIISCLPVLHAMQLHLGRTEKRWEGQWCQDWVLPLEAKALSSGSCLVNFYEGASMLSYKIPILANINSFFRLMVRADTDMTQGNKIAFPYLSKD